MEINLSVLSKDRKFRLIITALDPDVAKEVVREKKIANLYTRDSWLLARVSRMS
jgi:hypothetical protein